MKRLMMVSSLLVTLSLARNSQAAEAENVCISGGRILAIQQNFPMELSLPVEGVSTETTIPVENVVGGEGDHNWFTMLGFFTFDEVRAKYCKGTVTGRVVLHYPSYEKTLGQNGFYWHLKRPQETRDVSHLFIHGGAVKEGRCEEAIEGGAYYVISCKN